MSIFHIFYLGFMLGVSNSNATMKFVQLQYFYHKILGVQKILCPPCSKIGRNTSTRPTFKLGPWYTVHLTVHIYFAHVCRKDIFQEVNSSEISFYQLRNWEKRFSTGNDSKISYLKIQGTLSTCTFRLPMRLTLRTVFQTTLINTWQRMKFAQVMSY